MSSQHFRGVEVWPLFFVRVRPSGGSSPAQEALTWVLLPLLRRSRKHLRCDSVASGDCSVLKETVGQMKQQMPLIRTSEKKGETVEHTASVAEERMKGLSKATKRRKEAGAADRNMA